MINLTQNSNIRRIDELGRIVIPKDIRKKLHIKDNEPLEIFIESGEIRIKKYSSLPDVIDYIKYLIDIGNRITGHSFIVTDREKVVASTDKTFETLPIGDYLENIVLTSQDEKNKDIDFRLGIANISGKANVYPLIVDNDRTGLIIEYSNNPITSQDVIKVFKNLIESRLNNY